LRGSGTHRLEEVAMDIPGFEGQAPAGVVKRAVKDFVDDDMLTYAAALSYHILLALFPFVIFLLTVLGALGLSDFFNWLLGQARLALPPDAFQLISEVIGEIRGRSSGSLLSVSILFAIWAASGGVRSLMDSLNVAYDVAETRPAWQRYPLSIAYTIGLAILLIVASGLMLVGPRAATWLAGQMGLSQVAAAVWTWLRWPVAVLLVLLTIALVYYVAPNVDQQFKFVTPGSVVAVVGWIVASLVFSAYVERFSDYGATYGSLGAMVILLIYFFVSSAVLLFGAEVNAVIFKTAAAAGSEQVSRPDRAVLPGITPAGRGAR
jgi:membrane protein